MVEKIRIFSILVGNDELFKELNNLYPISQDETNIDLCLQYLRNFFLFGKTKDAFALFRQIGQKDTLFVVDSIDVKTESAFRNLQKCYIVDSTELNAYLVAVFKSVVVEKAVFEKLIKEG